MRERTKQTLRILIIAVITLNLVAATPIGTEISNPDGEAMTLNNIPAATDLTNTTHETIEIRAVNANVTAITYPDLEGKTIVVDVEESSIDRQNVSFDVGTRTITSDRGGYLRTRPNVYTTFDSVTVNIGEHEEMLLEFKNGEVKAYETELNQILRLLQLMAALILSVEVIDYRYSTHT